jgi:hypothetical protein
MYLRNAKCTAIAVKYRPFHVVYYIGGEMTLYHFLEFDAGEGYQSCPLAPILGLVGGSRILEGNAMVQNDSILCLAVPKYHCLNV